LDNKGYYAILGVSEQAKYYEIKAAYRRLAKKYHPDVSHSNNSYSSLMTNEDMIKKINAAYEVLSDKDKRNEYDHNEVYDDSIIDGNTNDNDLQQQDNKAEADIGKDDERADDKSEKDNIGSNNKKHSSTYYNVYSDSKNNNNSFDKDHYNTYNTYATSQTQGSKSSSSFAKTKDTNRADMQKSPFHIVVEPSLCMAFGSCEKLAPKTFVVEKDIMFNPKAKVISEITEGEGEDFDAILAAAETCPTKAIIIIDRNTGQQIYP
jgi:curved DNA-binding protein CbpA